MNISHTKQLLPGKYKIRNLNTWRQETFSNYDTSARRGIHYENFNKRATKLKWFSEMSLEMCS